MTRFAKRIIPFVLLLTLAVCLVGCDGTVKYSIDGHDWIMTTAQSTESGDFVAYNPSDDSFDAENYPNIVAVDLTFEAKNGLLTVENKTDGVKYARTYKEINSSSAGTQYEITIGEKSGMAVASATKYSDGTEVLTLILSVDGYAINFQSK